MPLTVHKTDLRCWYFMTIILPTVVPAQGWVVPADKKLLHSTLWAYWGYMPAEFQESWCFAYGCWNFLSVNWWHYTTHYTSLMVVMTSRLTLLKSVSAEYREWLLKSMQLAQNDTQWKCAVEDTAWNVSVFAVYSYPYTHILYSKKILWSLVLFIMIIMTWEIFYTVFHTV